MIVSVDASASNPASMPLVDTRMLALPSGRCAGSSIIILVISLCRPAALRCESSSDWAPAILRRIGEARIRALADIPRQVTPALNQPKNRSYPVPASAVRGSGGPLPGAMRSLT